MGKVEDLRRLREQRAADASRQAPVAARPVRPRPAGGEVREQEARTVDAPAPEAEGESEGEGEGEQRCGHQSIGGRSCTRERDHQKAGTKNHRYS